MKKIFRVLNLLTLSLFAISIVLSSVSADPVGPRDPAKTVYVTSQNLYFDTIVPISSAEGLPWNEQNTGSFQELYDGMTDYGPGDPGYRGGRWWIDSNPNGYQDAYDTYFLCPLLGPGRESP